MPDFNQTLGITIPTYRRPDWLGAAVRSVFVAAKPLGVPVFLADDSGDETNVAVVEELRREYDHLVHVRNDRNLGIDRNIANSVRICTCEYAWPLGEDDLLRPDAVEQVLARLEGGDQRPSFVSVNYSLFNEEYTEVLRERFMPIREDRMIESEQFLRKWGWAIGFIGACVINKSLWETVDPSRYFGTYWAHVGVIMESVRGQQVRMIAEPLVQKRIGSPRVFSWSDTTFQVVDGWKELMHRMVPVYGEDACREGDRAFERVFGLGGRFLVYARSEGLYDASSFRSRILGKGKALHFVAIAWIIAHMPRGMARLLLRTSRKSRMLWNRIRGTVRVPTLPSSLC